MKRERHDSDDEITPKENVHPIYPSHSLTLSKRRLKPKIIPAVAATMSRANQAISVESTKESQTTRTAYVPLNYNSKPEKALKKDWDNYVPVDFLVSKTPGDLTDTKEKESAADDLSYPKCCETDNKSGVTEGTDNGATKPVQNNMTIDLTMKCCREFISKYRPIPGAKVAEDRCISQSDEHRGSLLHSQERRDNSNNNFSCTSKGIKSNSEQHELHPSYATVSTSCSNTCIDVPSRMAAGRSSCNIQSTHYKEGKSSTVDMGYQGITHSNFTLYQDMIIRKQGSSSSQILNSNSDVTGASNRELTVHLQQGTCYTLNEVKNVYTRKIIENEYGEESNNSGLCPIQSASCNSIINSRTVMGCTSGFRWDGILRGNPTVLQHYAKK
eukprot:Tbor_TRINITY_DN3809_c0_g1::TRINITY_DN3809_c0_g1_i1::g.5664::m.5664